MRNPGPPVPRFFDLNKREREVLCELVAGKDHQRIADALGIKYFTVNHRLKSIYRKMEVSVRRLGPDPLEVGIVWIIDGPDICTESNENTLSSLPIKKQSELSARSVFKSLSNR